MAQIQVKGVTLTDVVDLVQHYNSDEAVLSKTLEDGTPSPDCCQLVLH